ncbi:MAG: hypothetical protein MUE38_02900 [Flavihumibacter sp.]|nr:hypothetical protein [Flavihumibacter sp.]
MKAIYKIQQLFIWLACFGVLALAGCDKEDDTNNGLVQLLSFGPSGIQHGEDIQFIGNNLHKVTAIQFIGARVEKAGFKSQSPETIVLVLYYPRPLNLVK